MRQGTEAGTLRQRLLPAPWLSLLLLGLWLTLNQSLSLGHLLLGGVLAVVGPLATRSLRPSPVRLRRPFAILRLVGIVLKDALGSNLEVGRLVWRMGRRPPRSAFVVVPLHTRDPNALAVLAVIATLVPGTVWAELAMDRSRLLVHVFDVDDEAAFIADFKRRYEMPLVEIFG